VVLKCDAGEGGSAFEVRFGVLRKVTMKISVFCDVQPVASGLQVGAIYQLQIWMHLLGNCKIFKINMLIGLLNTCNNLPYPCVATVELPWLETTHFQII
jgi:hypothetical protein